MRKILALTVIILTVPAAGLASPAPPWDEAIAWDNCDDGYAGRPLRRLATCSATATANRADGSLSATAELKSWRNGEGAAFGSVGAGASMLAFDYIDGTASRAEYVFTYFVESASARSVGDAFAWVSVSGFGDYVDRANQVQALSISSVGGWSLGGNQDAGNTLATSRLVFEMSDGSMLPAGTISLHGGAETWLDIGSFLPGAGSAMARISGSVVSIQRV